MKTKLRLPAAFIGQLLLLSCVSPSIAQTPTDKAIDQIIRQTFRKHSKGADLKRRTSMSPNDWPGAQKFLKVERLSLPILSEPGLTHPPLHVLGIAKSGEIFPDLGCQEVLTLVNPLGGGVDESGMWCRVRLFEGREGWLFAKPANQNNWFVSSFDLSPPAPSFDLSPILFGLLVIVGLIALIIIATKGRSNKKEYSPAGSSSDYAGTDYSSGHGDGGDYVGADYSESLESPEDASFDRDVTSAPAMFGMVKCPDCDGEQWFDPNCGDGKCSTCHGTGQELDFLEGVTDALSGLPQVCDTCHGAKECQTCFGKGYLET